MFYEESVIKYLLKCKRCEQDLNEYDEPRILPCGITICGECSFKMQKNALKNKFKCDSCQDEHLIPETGFILNKTLSEFTKIQPKEVFRSKECEKFKQNLNKIECLASQLAFDFENGVDKIKDHCAEQRRLVQLATEKRIEEINKINQLLIEQIDLYETEWIQRYSNKKRDLETSINETCDEAKRFLNEKKNYLKDYHINEEEIREFDETCEILKIELNQELKLINREIFNDKLIKFDSSTASLSEKIIGNLYYEKFEPIKLLSGSFDKSIKLWDLETGKCLRTFLGHTGYVMCVNFSGNKLISGSKDNTIKIWNLNTGECLMTIFAHSSPISCIRLIAKDKVISCSWDKIIKLWDLNTGDCIKTFEGHQKETLCIDVISNDKFVSGSVDKSIKLWDLNLVTCSQTLNGHSGIICCLKVTKAGLFSGSWDKTMKLWDLNTGECLRTFEGHIGGITCIRDISTDEIASCSEDKTIRIWRINSGDCLKTIEAHSNIVWFLKSLSNNKIISASKDKTVKVWDIKSSECLKTIEGHTSDVFFLDVI